MMIPVINGVTLAQMMGVKLASGKPHKREGTLPEPMAPWATRVAELQDEYESLVNELRG